MCCVCVCVLERVCLCMYLCALVFVICVRACVSICAFISVFMCGAQSTAHSRIIAAFVSNRSIPRCAHSINAYDILYFI